MTVRQGSKTLETAILLTLTGGFLDAYTYFARGGVFANAQTGNIIKLGINLALGKGLETCMRYLIPIAVFVIGVITAMVIDHILTKMDLHIIRRTALLIEIAALVIAAFIPRQEEYNIIANALVSFACAIQMEAFTRFADQPIATTVSTGNLRKFVEFTFRAAVNRNSRDLKTAGIYLLIVILFVSGVAAGTVLTNMIGVRSILIAAFLLGCALVTITVKTKVIPQE